MRSLDHWTPRYVVNRSRLYLGQKLRPNEPWLTREAIGLLERLLRPTDIAAEFGSGRSTLWFAPRVAHLTSVEEDEAWFRTVGTMLQAQGIGNVDYLLRPQDVPEPDGDKSAYARVLEAMDEQSLDFVLVDGAYRCHCATRAIDKLKPGGLLVIDNANWYLPTATRSPPLGHPIAPKVEAVWRTFAERTQSWRRVWTSNGVTDTLILFKS